MNVRLPLAILLAFALGASYACSDGGPKDPAPPAQEDPKPGDGTDDPPPPEEDPRCKHDKDCPDTTYCQLSSGECLDAKTCQTPEHCEYQWAGELDYCAFGGCFCDLERGGGTCRPRIGLCRACESDLECGNDDVLNDDYVATCQEFGGAKVCLPRLRRSESCPPAYLPTSDGTGCIPAGGVCPPKAPCTRDADCDPMGETPVCDTGRGFCVEACTFDFSDGTSTCPPAQVCHVDKRLLTAQNPNFGGGKCGGPCDEGEAPVACGDTLSCVVDGDPLLVDPLPTRCRPKPPKCIRNADCPQSPDTNSNGYCDLQTLACSKGCQKESDCFSGFKCSAGACVEKTCVEKGGANFACAFGEFCCGEPGSPTPCPNGVAVGKCYPAENPPWCGDGCSPLGTATTPMSTPGGFERPQASRCVQAQGTEAKGTVNLLFHSCDKEDPKKAACPRSWECMSFIQFCEGDADCGPNGKCSDIDAGTAGKYKGCSCSDGNACPSPSACGVDDEGNSTGICMASWCDNLRNCGLTLPEEPADPGQP